MSSRSPFEFQGSACPAVFPAEGRTAKALRRGERAGVFAAETSARTDQTGGIQAPPRSEASLRSESLRARFDALPRSLRPLAKARSEFAAAFDTVMNEHWLRGEEAYSNVAVARACGVDEKTVRAWRSEEKPMPAAALTLIPTQVYGEVLDYLASARGRTPKRALVKLRESLGELAGQLAHEDGAEVVRALVGVQGQVAALMTKAMGER